MSYRTRWLAGVCIAGLIASGHAAPPRVTDEAVENAVQRAVQYLKSKRNAEGHWEHGDANGRYWAGPSSLCAMALLYAGEDPRSDDMAKTLDWLSFQQIRSTYVYGCRSHVFSLIPGRKYRGRLADDLAWLLKAVVPKGKEGAGAYDYESAGESGGGSWDNSNAQYGVLGVWMATDAGLAAPETYWELVGEHWMGSQNKDGGWGYRSGGTSTGSMTAAGLATLYVVLDRIYGDRPGDARALVAAIDRGTLWFASNFGPENVNGDSQWAYYYLYGVERVGRASGQKYFKSKDWFKMSAEALLQKQRADGSWEGTGSEMTELVNTAFGLMVLCHGRAPVMFAKLEHGADWNSKLRDCAGLTHYANRSLERLLNWQIMRLDSPIEDLLESQVLYLCGEDAWNFTDTDIQRIREYCRRGGMLFAVASKDSRKFQQSMEELAKKVFPDFPLRPIGKEHPLFSGKVQFEIKDPPPMFEVHNGIRPMMVFCPKDIAESWNRGQIRGDGERNFQIGINVFLYATDKTSIRSRLQSPVMPVETVEIKDTIQLARIKYGSKWDNIEPVGWTRVAAYLNNTAQTRLLVTSGVELNSPQLQEFNVAYIVGTDPFELTAEQKDGLKKFIQKGGTLLADAGGGSTKFIESLEKVLKEILRDDPKPLPADSFFNTGAGIPGGADLRGVGVRRAARGEAGLQKTPKLRVFDAKRRYSVIYCTLDLTVGTLGTQVFELKGYDPDGTLKILKNMILYANLSVAQKAALARGGKE